MDKVIECGGFVFLHNFDSGNLGHVEQIPKNEIVPSPNHLTNVLETPDYEFNVWTRPDCAGTEFENGNRTWFYFGVQGAPPHALVKLNIVNLNRQGKMFSQGMAPVTKTIPGRNNWERIKDRPTYFTVDNIFTLSFKYRSPDNGTATSYFAFTYPYTYAELQSSLQAIDSKMAVSETKCDDDIYYYRECVCHSLEGRRMDMLTISSYHGITNTREDRLQNLFPEENIKRPFKFLCKKVVFVSARVHPGETPSSFVLNGLLSLLLNRHDPVAMTLRRLYVFKLIPFLNPDGVARGHYRTDTRGVNLNRVYLAPSSQLHPTVYAARALIRYYHFGFEKEDELDPNDNVPIDPTCESDCNSSHDFVLSKDLGGTDQENVKSYMISAKRKMVSSPRDANRRWSGIHNQSGSSRVPLQSKTTGANSGTNTHRNKIKVDSEDDTTSSVIITSPTLADQVEDLNLNELQQSMDGFSRSAMDDDCAVDHIIKPPTALSPNNNLTKLCHALDLITDDDDDDDSASCGAKPFTFNLCNSLKSLKSNNGKSNNSLSMSDTLKFSQTWCSSCMQTVNGLEARMPGISSMLPNRHKAQDVNSQSSSVLKCINCHSSLGAKMEQPIRPLVPLGNFSVPGQGTSTLLATPNSANRNFNKNCMGSPKAKVECKTSGKAQSKIFPLRGRSSAKDTESGLFLYLDLHGHASKKGIFMYGNHFEEPESSVECMLLPRIMSLNNLHFHFTSCNFTERNMYLRDRRDGMSREGSGRVAVLKATGLTRSYTLECNYNTGRLVNSLPPSNRDMLSPPTFATTATPLSPPKYTPQIFEEVGKSVGASILDLTSHHPNSRIPNSEHRNLHGIREWLRAHHKHQSPPQTSISCPSTSSPSSSLVRPSRSRPRPRLERKENLLDLPPVKTNTASRLRSTKFLKSLSEQQFLTKAQRNLSLISIKKPAVAKHNRVYKQPLNSKSPGRRSLLGIKSSKHSEEGESTKTGVRSLMDSNKINKQRSFETKTTSKADFKQKDTQKQKSDISVGKKQKLRNKEASYQKQQAQFVTKPITKRLKISQFIKYSDNAKEKYRVRKNIAGKGGASGSLTAVIPEPWETSSDLNKLAARKFI